MHKFYAITAYNLESLLGVTGTTTTTKFHRFYFQCELVIYFSIHVVIARKHFQSTFFYSSHKCARDIETAIALKNFPIVLVVLTFCAIG